MSAELPGAAGGVDILSLMLHASVVVQLVLLTLVAASVFSWASILQKKKAFAAAAAEAEAFGGKFWNGGDLGSLYRAAEPRRRELVGLEAVFEAGFREFSRLRTAGGLDAGELMDGARRAMRASLQREMDAIESNLSMLASVGSVSPYVGLFGTVWGIMHAFTGLAGLQQVTLAKVAPGIAEALVATAIGLFAAIPAVLAFNRFSRDIDRVANKLETFIEEFSNILQRNVGAAPTTNR